MYDDNAYCRKCGQMIRFIRTRRGKLMPVDSFSLRIVPNDRGGIYFTEDGSTVRGVEVSTPGPNCVTAWQSHFVTCPATERERSRAKAESWNEMRDRTAKELQEKKDAETAAKAARRAEKERREAAERAFMDTQTSLFGT